MTAIVGMLCNDGVVIGADSSSTFSTGRERTIEQPSEKISIIGGSIIIAGTGQVGLDQRFTEVVSGVWSNKQFQQGTPMQIAKVLSANGINDFASTGLSPGAYGALVAYPNNKKPCLCEFAISDFQPEMKTADRIWYCSMGSGQNITDPFLAFMRSVFWADGRQPNVREGVFATAWALEHVVDCNPGGVDGPISIAVLERNRNNLAARRIRDEELDEIREHIDEAKTRLRDFIVDFQLDEVPEIPKPDD